MQEKNEIEHSVRADMIKSLKCVNEKHESLLDKSMGGNVHWIAEIATMEDYLETEEIVLTDSFVIKHFRPEFVRSAVNQGMGDGKFLCVPTQEQMVKLENGLQACALMCGRHDLHGRFLDEPVWFAAFADKDKEMETVSEEWVAKNFSEKFI